MVLVLIRVLNLPGEADGREVGLWLGLIATLGIIAGGLVGMRDERRSPQGRHTDVTGVPVSSPREIETRAGAAARGRLLTFERLRISDWVVFVAALALLFTTAAPVWYSTKAGDEARRVQQEAQPEEGQPSGQSEAEVEREAGRARRQRREDRLGGGRHDRPRSSSICVLATSVLGVLAGFWRASGRPARGIGPYGLCGLMACITRAARPLPHPPGARPRRR